MPVSEQQLAANHANAQHSTGSNAPEGRKRSSQNALRHGITAQTTIMTEKDRMKHDEFCANMMADLTPVGSYHRRRAAGEANFGYGKKRSRPKEVPKAA